MLSSMTKNKDSALNNKLPVNKNRFMEGVNIKLTLSF